MTGNPSGRKSGGSWSWIWMILAILTMGGLMAWLGVASQPESRVVVDEGWHVWDDSELLGTAKPVSLDAIAADPASHVGQEVILADIMVSSRLGEAAFWAESSDGIPFLVKLSSELVESGVKVEKGDVVTVTGSVLVMTPEIIAEWEAAGVLLTDSDRAAVEFAIAFLEASELTTGR